MAKAETTNDRFRDTRLSFKPKPSQSRYAEILGISVATVQKIEQGDMEVSDSTLLALKNKLNVNPDFILKGGKAEMFINGKAPDISVFNTEMETDGEFKMDAWNELKDKNKHLEGEIAFLRGLLSQFAAGFGGGKVTGSFLALINRNTARSGKQVNKYLEYA